MDDIIQSPMFIDYQYEEPIIIKLRFIHRITWYIALSQYINKSIAQPTN